MKKNITLNKPILIGLVLLCSHIQIYAQDSITYKNETINRIDRKDNRQGIWKLYNHDESIYLECNFVDDTIKDVINIYQNENIVFQVISPNKERKEFIAFHPTETIKGYFTIIDKKPALMDMSDKEITGEISEWIWNHSNIMPMFYGGRDALIEYIQNNINPENTKGRKGKVIVQFGIDRFGNVYIIGLSQKSYKDLNREAIRVIKSMPRWQPGFNRGLFVKTQYLFPVNFK
jgi:hypothetical protein